jgi:hypothetical protein
MRRTTPRCFCAALLGAAAATAFGVTAGLGPAEAQSLTPPPAVGTPGGAPTSVPPWSSLVVDTDDVAAALSRAATTAPPPTPAASTSKPAVTKPLAKKKAKVSVAPTSSTIAVVVLAAGAPGAGSTGTADDPSVWAALRKCESGGRYDLNTGNGYYGAYQFALGTWQRLGYGGYPHEAAPSVQDEAAKRLQAKLGWVPWSSCARRIGAR